MEPQLLALTRRRRTASPDTSPEAAASDSMRQLIQLRWIAVVGQLATILLVHFGFGVALPLAVMLGIAGVLVAANLVCAALLTYGRVGNFEIMLALLLDIAALTVQLQLSGGATNPFISFYLLQVVLGAILLEMWSAWVVAAVTSLSFAALIVAAVPLVLPLELRARSDDLFMLGRLISFSLTATLLGLFVTRLTRNLRARERYLADMRQHAAEEDGIVRMGLFASGAAHELGTPLASLAVILGDWQRMPRLAGDPELAGELAEMQAEVQRCKAIVTDILHSAGAPRDEAMESTSARAFLDQAVAAWRPRHGGVPLDYACEELGGAAVVAGASLRQAIWNLLDNAADVSPQGIGLGAARREDMLIVSVTDHGPGFAAGQLDRIGTPCQSSKGAGHGMGLFLTANVARRSGGRLEAWNRPPGGAEVRLVLPLARDPKGESRWTRPAGC